MRENTSDDACPSFHAARRESLTCMVNDAGCPIFVVSVPAMRLFQPIVTALCACVDPRERNGTGDSFHTARESLVNRTPGTEPDVTSTSSSKSAAVRNALS